MSETILHSRYNIILTIIAHPNRAIKELAANPTHYRTLAIVMFIAYVSTSYAENIYSAATEQMQTSVAFYLLHFGDALVQPLLVITIAWYVAKKFGATWQLSTAFVLLSTVMIIVMIGSLAIFAVLELYDIMLRSRFNSCLAYWPIKHCCVYVLAKML